jgi:hypothetical protein
VHPHGRQAPGGGPTLALLAPTIPAGGHGQKYPAMSSCDHGGWRTRCLGANSVM